MKKKEKKREKKTATTVTTVTTSTKTTKKKQTKTKKPILTHFESKRTTYRTNYMFYTTIKLYSTLGMPYLSNKLTLVLSLSSSALTCHR